MAQDASEDGEPHTLVLPSSTELFYFYAQNLEQCAKLFTGQPLFDLCQLHKKWLRIYAGALRLIYHGHMLMLYLKFRGGVGG